MSKVHQGGFIMQEFLNIEQYMQEFLNFCQRKFKIKSKLNISGKLWQVLGIAG
jgi:hypothetical protein